MSVNAVVFKSNKKVFAAVVALLTMLSVLTGFTQPAHAAAGDVSGVIVKSGNTSTKLADVYVTATKSDVTKTVLSNTDGSFTLGALAVGDYQIKFLKYGYQTAWYSGSATGGTVASTTTAASATFITASTGAIALGNIELVEASGRLSGRVYAGATNVTTGATVKAYMDGSSTVAATTTLDSSGNYLFDKLTAGSYKLEFLPDSTNYIREYSGDSSTLAGATSVTVNYTTPATLDAYIAAAATISGTTYVGAVATGGFKVELFTANGELAITNDTTTAATVTSDSTTAGAFTLSGVTPGAYYLKFSKATYTDEWWDNKFSLATATAITVSAGQNLTGLNPVLSLLNTDFLSTATATIGVTGSATEGATLTATITGFTNATEFTYQWHNSSGPIYGANKSTYVIQTSDYGKTIFVRVTGYASGYKSASKDSPVTATVVHGFLAYPKPTITGRTTVGYTLTANAGTWNPVPDSFTWAWYRDGVVISGNTSNTYTLATADAGKVITVLAEPHLAGYDTSAFSQLSLGTAAIGNLMTTTPAATISGDAIVGKTLTAVNGAWVPAAVTFTYQWLRSGNAITGATGSTYTLVAADVNTYISVQVTGAAAGYTSVQTVSAVTSPVLDALTATPVPTISGTTKVGNTLTANPGTWSPATVTLAYQWFRDGLAINGATSATYTVVAEDDLKFLTVKVTGSKSGYGNVTTTSASTQIGERFTTAPKPTIKGNAYVGQTFTATVGDWLPNPSFTYQWLRDGSPIAGAAALTYKTTTSDVGHKLSFSVTAAKSGYINSVQVSNESGKITAGRPFTKIVAPKISGTAKVGVTLRALTYRWTPAFTKVTYQWTRNNVAIKGATKSTYKLVIADRGSQIRVVITGTKSGYAPTAKASSLTAKVK